MTKDTKHHKAEERFPHQNTQEHIVDDVEILCDIAATTVLAALRASSLTGPERGRTGDFSFRKRCQDFRIFARCCPSPKNMKLIGGIDLTVAYDRLEIW